MDSVCEAQLLNRDSTIKDQSNSISKHEQIEKDMRELDQLNQHKIEALKASLLVKDDEIKAAKNAAKKQKILKLFFGAAGVAATGFMTYLWISK